MKHRFLRVILESLKFTCYILIIQALFITSLMASNANAQMKSVKEVYIQLDLKNASVTDIFEDIETETSFKFHFFKRDIKNNIRLDFADANLSVAEVLYKVAEAANLKFRQVNENIAVSRDDKTSEVVSVIEVLPITGTVTDDKGEPLAGVNVVVKGTTIGTITDINGNYSLEIPEKATLVFSFVGLLTEEVVVGTNSVVDVRMQPDAKTLTEVIVVAYGTSKKGSFTGSATQINSEALEGRALTNITSAIEGVAGVQFSPGSGQPGSTSPLRIRGFGSVNASSRPLYVVDGIIFSGSLSSINPNDIESITILKDASSTALYGSKAANGVVLLTTKTGKSGKPKFSVNVSQGVTSRFIPEYERVSAEQYYPLMWEALRNSLSISGNTPQADANQRASDGIFDELETNPFNVPNDEIVLTDGTLNPNAQLLYPDDLDWQDQLTRGGARTNVDMSYQGGSGKSNYFVSMGYLNDKGWILNADFERISGRINVTTQPKEWIKTGFNLSGATSNSNQAADAGSTSFVNPFFSTRNIAPIYPVFEHDPVTGEFILDERGNPIYDLGDNRVGNTNGRHAIQETILNVDRDRIFSVSARSFVDLYFLKDFKFTFNASLDKRFFNNEEFDNPIVGDGQPAGRAGRDASTRTSVSFNQLLNYTKDFNNHSISILAGHESFEYEFNLMEGNRLQLVAEGNTELINFTTTSNLNSRTDLYTTEGYLGRIEYDYDDRYFFSSSFRRDGSSRFDRSVRWGNFWSVGGAWRIDQEAFASNFSMVDLLKLRASYGQVGNDSNLSDDPDNNGISFYASQALFALNNNNASEPGILFDALDAPALGWEANSQFDVALEFGLLNDRISGSFEYYDRITDNLLFEVPLPLSYGIDDVNRNIGSMFNRGFEVNLSADVIRGRGFSWRLSVNASTLKNEFTKLPQDEIINGTKKLVVGGSIYDYWLRDWYGVDPEDGAALYVLDPDVDETDAAVRTVDGVLVTTDQNDAKFDFVGTAVPDVFGSFTNTLSYKGVRLGFLFTYQVGGETYDTNFASLMSSGDYGDALSTEILGRWQKPGDRTDVPRLDASKIVPFGAASDRWLVSSSYISLRQINLSYDLPDKYTELVGMSSARIYVNAENLFLRTKRKGMDVNQNFNGTTQNRFTPSRVVTVGLNVAF